jgi:putative glutamine amidotransferase
MPRPLVALTASSTPPAGPGHSRRVRINDAYVRALQAAGLVPLIIPPSLNDEEARALVAGVAGIVLSGGEDVDPSTYGATRHPATQQAHAGRDASELALIAAAHDAKRPLFAICRGVQLLNVALGGTLVQDLPSLRPDAIRHTWDDARDQRVHGITVQPGSRLAAALGTTALHANSMHHQAVDRLATSLHATAHAPDGVVEGVEFAGDDWWALGVQWHPEELTDDPHPWDRALFAAFAHQCRQ